MFLYLLLIFTIISFIISFSFFKKRKKTTKKQIIFKTNSDLYDKEYVEMYDTIHYDYYRTQKEINIILPTTSSDSIVLDIGSGTGHYVHELQEKGVRAIGIDNSSAMVQYSTKYPHHYIHGNVLEISMFPKNSFTHATCLYYTLYYINHKEQLFYNVYHWLIPGGLFMVHLTSKCNFGKPSIKDTKYTYTRKIQENKVYETITQGNKLRRNEHSFYMEPIQTIVTMAQEAGFIVVSSETYDFTNFIYILKKPE